MTVDDISRYLIASDGSDIATMIFNHIGEGILITDHNKIITSINAAVTRLTGFTQEDVIGQSACWLYSSQHKKTHGIAFNHSTNSANSWQGEIWRRKKSGGDFSSWTIINEVKDASGQVSHYIHLFMDISVLSKTHTHLGFLAYHDPLTRLPNRLLLIDRITHALQNARREASAAAVLFIDVDRFKQVNDSYGHVVGDGLLKEIAKRLRSIVRKDDTVCRYAGDEFIVFMESIPDVKNPATLAQKLIDSFREPLCIRKIKLPVSISIGISLFPSDSEDAEALIKHADAAMYRAKKEGRNNFQYYRPGLTTEAFEKVAMEKALRLSILKNQLVLYYQPQVCLKTGRHIGVESLVRWNHPHLGLISAQRFIPLAEASEFIVPLGEWVLQQSCAQMRRWLDAGLPVGKISVNVAAGQLLHSNFAAMLEQMLHSHRLKPECLTLEISTGSLLGDSEQSLNVLHQLAVSGIDVTLNGFGSSGFSLRNLQRVPVKTLKMDSSLIFDVTHNHGDEAMARSVIALGHSLHLQVMALGVESEAQKNLLLNLGCDEGQGFFYGSPLLPNALSFNV